MELNFENYLTDNDIINVDDINEILEQEMPPRALY